MPTILQRKGKYVIYNNNGKIMLITSDRSICVDYFRSLTTK